MIVVSDTSPILNLDRIGRLRLLEQIYGQLVMPAGVEGELRRNGFDPAGTPWLLVRHPKSSELLTRLMPELDRGEAEAIALAKELGADALLIDEARGREVARRHSLEIMGVLGVLAAAKRFGLIPACGPLVEALQRDAGFWVSDHVRRQFLRSEGEL